MGEVRNMKKNKTLIWVLSVILALVLGTAGYANWSPPWGQYQGFDVVKVIVDGREVSSDVPAVIIDGRTMVPLRLVAESMGRKIEWDQDGFAAKVTNVNGRPEREPQIDQQAPDFDRRIRETLALLKEKAPERYKSVVENIDAIVAGSANSALSRNNTVTINTRYYKAYSRTELASILVHEARHLEMYHVGDPLVWDAVAYEKEAYKAERDFLVEVGAPQVEIDVAEKYIKDPPVVPQ